MRPLSAQPEPIVETIGNESYRNEGRTKRMRPKPVPSFRVARQSARRHRIRSGTILGPLLKSHHSDGKYHIDMNMIGQDSLLGDNSEGTKALLPGTSAPLQLSSQNWNFYLKFRSYSPGTFSSKFQLLRTIHATFCNLFTIFQIGCLFCHQF